MFLPRPRFSHADSTAEVSGRKINQQEIVSVHLLSPPILFGLVQGFSWGPCWLAVLGAQPVITFSLAKLAANILVCRSFLIR